MAGWGDLFNNVQYHDENLKNDENIVAAMHYDRKYDDNGNYLY